MNRKAFTLVELLAVIVILGVILLIAVPKVISTINNSKLASMSDTTRMIAAQAEREYTSRSTLNLLDQTNDPITCDDVSTISANDYSNCSVSFDGESAYVNITGKGNLDGLICVNGTRLDGKCGKSLDVYQESILNGAYPRVTEGMIPVTIANNGTVTTVNPTSSSWYNYTNKQWANVVLVKESGTQTRTYYENNYNVTVNESDILAYLVWIPRYRYTLWNVAGNTSTYSGSTCTANCPQSISITFENASTTKSTGTTNGTQLTHPAFTSNGIELNGIWVGKFETTKGTVSNVGTTNPTIKPNIPSWSSASFAFATVSTAFTKSLTFGSDKQYGLIGDSRMSKNADWGAIVYLSHSIYGINGEIRVNNHGFNAIPNTGCGASTVDETQTTTCQIPFGGATDYPQSSTGNIYGIFDLSGGGNEYQMGFLTDSLYNIYTGTCNILNSGFNGKYGNPSLFGTCNASLTEKTDGVNFPNSRYYDLYYFNPSWSSDTRYFGQALGETNGWYRDWRSFFDSGATGRWIIRGGSFNQSSPYYAGGFANSNSHGDNGAFRIIVTTI